MISREKTQLNTASYDSLSFFKDVLLMLLDTSSTQFLAASNTHALITTLLQVFCELLDDKDICKESESKENTIPFILKILLASAKSIEVQTIGL